MLAPVTPTSGKLLNIAFGLASIPLMVALGRRVESEAVGRWSALLLTITPTLVIYNSTLGYEIVYRLLTVGCLQPQPWNRAKASTAVFSRIDRVDAGIWQLGPTDLHPGTGITFCILDRVSPRRPCCALYGHRDHRNGLCHRALDPEEPSRVWHISATLNNGGITLYSANNPASDGLCHARSTFGRDRRGEGRLDSPQASHRVDA